MPWLTTVTFVGVVVLAALIWLFVQTRSKDLLEEKMAKRKASSKAVCKSELLEGPNRIAVVMSLEGNRVIYENADLDAFLEMENMEEIEYDDESSTGHHAHGRILRLRSHGHAFEFDLDKEVAKQWEALLPPFSAGRQQAV
jgi:hypothetical protein